MWVSVAIVAGGLGDEGGLVHWDPVVSTQGLFGGDLPGPDPVSDRLGGHAEESGGFCRGNGVGVHRAEDTQERKECKRTPGSRGGRAPGVL